MRVAGLRRFALSLPQAEERETWGEATFRVRNRIFMMLVDGEREAWVKASRLEQEALLGSDPEVFFHPPYVGGHGWIGVGSLGWTPGRWASSSPRPGG
jgi:hypothetical protein